LDEVGAVEQRRIVANWIENQIKAYPECRFILSSRPQGFRDSQLQRVDVLEVQPFSAEQVREFVENWYAANEIMNSGGVDDMKVRERALNDANVLLQRLAVSAELSALAINPLLLTMVAMMHRYRGAVPRSRVELYAEICEVLLERWRQARGVQDNLTAAQKIIVLRQLAAYATERNLRQISTEDASAIIATPLKRIGIAAHERENFLYYLQETSGLLLEREAGHWTFVHHTFQEYLTAAQWQVERNTPRDWDKLVRNSWWYGTLAMYAAQGDGSSIMDACLEANTVQSLTLAAECLDVAQELDPELRQRAFEQLTEGMESNDPARRHIAAEVQLSRRLKLLHRIDERCEIDLSFLTCAEYQLFLDHKRAQGKHHQPDHWKDYRFSTNEGRSPIKGIRAEDAIAFCVWLTSRKGGSVRYRLPTPDEANKNPSIAREIATWCEDDTGLSLVGLTEREEQERIEQLSAFSYGTPVCSLRLVDVRGPDSVSWDISGSNELVQRVYRNLAFGIGISRAFNRTNDFPLVRALALDRDFTIESSREIAYSMAHALAKISGLPSIATSLEKKELSTARQQSSALLHGVPSEVTSVNSLLNEILAAATAENALQAQRAQRRCIAQMLVLAYGDNCQYVERVLKLYWWLQLVKGREEDKLASWEGIRVVREQVQI